MKKRSVIIMMIIPSVATLLIGIKLMIVTNTRNPDNGLQSTVSILEAAGLFLISLIVTSILLLYGWARLRTLRKEKLRSNSK